MGPPAVPPRPSTRRHWTAHHGSCRASSPPSTPTRCRACHGVPNGLATKEPTGAVWRPSHLLPQEWQLALFLPILSPQLYLVVVPARAAYSHSASLGSRVARARLSRKPAHVRLRVVPADVDHRAVAAAPALVRHPTARSVLDAHVPLGECRFVLRQGERRDADLPHRLLVLVAPAPTQATHAEGSGRNRDHPGSRRGDGRRPVGAPPVRQRHGHGPGPAGASARRISVASRMSRAARVVLPVPAGLLR